VPIIFGVGGMAKTLYLTGFETYPGLDDNATREVALRFDGLSVGRLKIVSGILPTSYQRAPKHVLSALQEHKPVGIVHLGLHLLDTVIRVESWACNEMTARLPDADGYQPFEESVDPEQEFKEILQSPFSIPDVVAEIRSEGYPARISRNAGRYVCNSVYYSTLNTLDALGSKVPAAFVHLPAPGLKPFGDTTTEPWHVDILEKAVKASLQGFARQLGALK
jgi:pyroglutamyl-peptidase